MKTTKRSRWASRILLAGLLTLVGWGSLSYWMGLYKWATCTEEARWVNAPRG